MSFRRMPPEHRAVAHLPEHVVVFGGAGGWRACVLPVSLSADEGFWVVSAPSGSCASLSCFAQDNVRMLTTDQYNKFPFASGLRQVVWLP